MTATAPHSTDAVPSAGEEPAGGLPIEELDPVQAERIRRAPLPTRQTLRRRRFLPVQVLKFIETNLRIVDIVARERLGL
ncbi:MULTISPECIES: hypothetical protein [unclassified Actinomyces]|uniref:hypothetical protein n=1 Tax=unclassified Actinomyces TaxID=2609248 RepID=UPI002016E48A|nr:MULTISPECIES: hypothetical protein [unclassified Actinomyces]MCL3778364.1 hypothetical protein [Actinomyces sp. AC-20-1]MCL3789952.1 hypothetical protein [Actinomyces sp. 187325]MCL3792169.1 hypothetical protein [Actinomyces sp. 186855]MCL3794336.1 hypothetical protein [Actinomyces sp. 217892]